jgi:type I restriction enzyme S subunit
MAVESWSKWPFSDVIDFQEGPGILAKDFHEEGVSLVRLSGLDRGGSVLEGCNYLDPETVKKRWAHFALQEGDILLSTSASLGRIAVVGKDAIGAIPYTGIIRMRPKDKRLYAPFIRYLLEGPEFQEQAEMVGVGSVIRHFGPMHLRQMSVRLPSPAEQHAIVHILCSLDDKIELNRRMNETLEAIARALFKSWFVDFDPVRAKAEGRDTGLPKHIAGLFPDSFEDSELGEIPKGWEVQRVGEIGSVVCGKTPPTQVSEYYGDDVPFITIPDMHGRIFATATQKRLSHSGADLQAKKMVPVGSICVSCIATAGLVVITSEAAQTNQQINSVVPSKKDATYFWFWCLRNLGDEIRAGGSGGSVLTNLSTGRFAALRLLVGLAKLRSAYHSLVTPIFGRILANERESRTLAALRDTLLPKLISGELRVNEAARFLETAT